MFICRDTSTEKEIIDTKDNSTGILNKKTGLITGKIVSDSYIDMRFKDALARKNGWYIVQDSSTDFNQEELC